MKQRFYALVLTAFLAANVFAQTPSSWRGPLMNGSYPDQGLLKEWPSEGPVMLWHFDDAGKGYSAPAIYNGKIYLTGTLNETGHVFVLDLNGKLITKYQYGKEFMDSYPGSRTTPTVVGDLLYVSSSMGEIFCMVAASGEVKWKKDLFKEFGGKQITWGVTESLLVDGDLVFATPGGEKYNVVAFNRLSGEVIWSSPVLGETSAYCSPLLIDLPMRKLLVTHTASHVFGLDAKTGKLLWSEPQPNRYSVHANTPLYHDGALVYFSGYGQGGGKLTLNEDGSAVTKGWFEKKFDSRMGGAVYHNGYIYGSGDASRIWFCIDWNSGEIKWESKDFATGNVILADGMIYGYTQRGELIMLKADPSGMQQKGKTMITLGSDQHWAHLVIHDGMLLVRHGEVLMAYGVR